MQAEWYRRQNGTEIGPLDWNQIVEAVRTGDIKPSDALKRGDGKWLAARNIQGLFSASDSATAPTSLKQLPGLENGQTQPPESKQKPRRARPGGSVDTNKSAAMQPTMDWDLSRSGSVAASKPSRDSDESARGNDDANDVLDDSNDLPQEGDSGFGHASKIVRKLGPGARLGKYEIIESIGEGGMGTVFKARHVHMDRLVALKILRTEAAQMQGAIERFQQEVRTASRLSHPNIVTAHDADEFNGVHVFVMEYIDGVNLDEVLSTKERLPYKEAVEIIIKAAEGLGYAHGEGVVHRDIKPGNLMLDIHGTVKILDMGLAFITGPAHHAQRAVQVTQADQILGTFDFMAPEQGEDAHQADHRADIYSLGCTLYKLITGEAPYSGKTTIQMIFAHREHEIPRMAARVSEVPFDLDSVFAKMVAKQPDMRYQSMGEVVSDLRACLNSEPISAWQTGNWAQADKADGNQGPSLMHEDAMRIEPTKKEFNDSDSDDEYMLAPLPEETKVQPRANAETEVAGKQKPAKKKAKKKEPEPEQEKPIRYFIRVMGDELGPYTIERLKKESLSNWDEVRREDSDKWIVAQDVEGLCE